MGSPTIILTRTPKRHYQLDQLRVRHYSQPRGFVGRSLCYAISFNGLYYGHIIAGSATKNLPGRNVFFSIKKSELNSIINNIFFHIEKVNNKYPLRNFSVEVLNEFIRRVILDWAKVYEDRVIGFESLVELPRTGELYRRAGWSCVGQTKGYTCKRVAGESTDSWGGKRVWDKKNLRPKLVFCKKVS